MSLSLLLLLASTASADPKGCVVSENMPLEEAKARFEAFLSRRAPKGTQAGAVSVPAAPSGGSEPAPFRSLNPEQREMLLKLIQDHKKKHPEHSRSFKEIESQL